MRIIAIDYGDARIGLAVSDLSATICGEAWTMAEWNMDEAARRIGEEARSRQVGRLVLGLPKNMDGSLGPRAQKSMELAEKLRGVTGLEVVLWDERRTTVDAHRILSECGNRRKNHKDKVDAVAAQLILEGYLGSL
jgi:putative Holliday junction resolvase